MDVSVELILFLFVFVFFVVGYELRQIRSPLLDFLDSVQGLLPPVHF